MPTHLDPSGGKRMPEKSMKEKLATGELVLCMNLRLARSVDIAMVAKAGGYDALYVDMQHAPYSIRRQRRSAPPRSASASPRWCGSRITMRSG
jgi:2-keto-3-deoxy-L-rhamnonate aldolase RhmA